MPRQRATPCAAPPLRISDEDWQKVVRALKLSPQQGRIVGLMLLGFKDKQIAAELGLKVPTVRTYIARMFDRQGVTDRVGLIVNACNKCIEIARGAR